MGLDATMANDEKLGFADGPAHENEGSRYCFRRVSFEVTDNNVDAETTRWTHHYSSGRVGQGNVLMVEQVRKLGW